MLKASPLAPIEDDIRKQAAQMGVPVSQYLAPFLKLIADGALTLTPRLEPVVPTPTK